MPLRLRREGGLAAEAFRFAGDTVAAEALAGGDNQLATALREHGAEPVEAE